MATKDQIKNEIFASMLKRQHGPMTNDIVVINIVRVALNKKYQYYLDAEEFNIIGDELVEAGQFRWNDNGQLALTDIGVIHLGKLK